ERFHVKKQLLVEEVNTANAVIEGPYYNDNGVFKTGIIEVAEVRVNRSDSDEFVLMDEDEYSWSINTNGDLAISFVNHSNGDVYKVAYLACEPIELVHPIRDPSSNLHSIKMINGSGFVKKLVLNSDFRISKDGYKIYFYDLYNSLLKSKNFTIYDVIEIVYDAPLTRRVNLAHEILLLLQDENGNDDPPERWSALTTRIPW
ncbi:MAG: hypothetical protein ACTSRS_21110, partial [Candidatus Helarchaeota archaeon]